MAGRIPQAFIDDLLSRIDIVDLVDEYVSLRKAGRHYQARCPFHDEKTPSFTVSREKQFYHCFGCGANGSAIGFVMDYTHLDFVEAVRQLADRVGLRLPEDKNGFASAAPTAPLYEALEQAARFYATQLREHPTAQRAVEYLKNRGLSGKIAADFDLGYAPPGWDNLLRTLLPSAQAVQVFAQAGLLVQRQADGHYDRFRDRVMFPIRDPQGRVVGFGARTLGDDQPKYLNSPETPIFRKGRELYGLSHARRTCKSLSRLLIVEGYMDVLALAQHGVHNVIATLGTATTKEHVERLFRVVPEIVFCFDGDDAGERAAWRALELALPQLKDGRYVGFLFMPRGEDPDSLVRRQGADIFQDQDRVTPVSDFLFNTLSKRANLATLEGRARLVETALSRIAGTPSAPLRQLLMQRLSELSGLEIDQLSSAKRVAAPIRPRKPPGPMESSISPSIVHRAIAALLREPTLALTIVSPHALAALDMPEIPLLLNVLEMVHHRPNITCGAILERWRETAEGRLLSRLAGWEFPVLGEGLKEEFAGAIAQLRRWQERQRREALLKAPLDQLSVADKQELLQLLSFASRSNRRANESTEQIQN